VSVLRRREIPMALYIIVMVFLIFSNYTGIAKNVAADVRSWGIAIATFAALIGVINISYLHIMKLYRRSKGWPYSIVMFTCFIVYFIVAYIYEPGYTWIISNLSIPLGAAFLSGFNTLGVIFRGSRARSIWSVLILFSVVATALLMVSLGPLISPSILDIATWIKDYPTTGVFRAVTIGIGIGLLMLVVRAILGMEKSYLGEM
jgi:hypothetical protein